MEGPAAGFGKWSHPGVPHKGWFCVHIEDLGEPSLICEMCERVEIRYVHHMEHNDYAEVLRCGCICAGHMEQDLERAKRREKSLRTAARRRRAWPTRKGWHRSSKGNHVIDEEGCKVTVFKKSGQYSAVISKPVRNFKKFSRKTFPTEIEAQLAAFDALIYLKDKGRI